MIKVLLLLCSEIAHLLFLLKIVVLELFLVNLSEGFLEAVLHHVLLQLCEKSGSSLHDYFEPIEHSATHCFVGCRLRIRLILTSEFLHSLLLFHLSLLRYPTNFKKVDDLKHMVNSATEGFQADFAVGRVREVARDNLKVQARVTVASDGQRVVGLDL
jgi:hypothetical protein